MQKQHEFLRVSTMVTSFPAYSITVNIENIVWYYNMSKLLDMLVPQNLSELAQLNMNNYEYDHIGLQIGVVDLAVSVILIHRKPFCCIQCQCRWQNASDVDTDNTNVLVADADSRNVLNANVDGTNGLQANIDATCIAINIAY